MTGTRGLAGLVLCGGSGRRMGRDKALLDVEGQPLVVRAAARLAAVADPVLLAPGRTGRLGDLGYPEVGDELPDAGPVAGLAAGLAASPHPLMAVVAVDLPFASPTLLRLLATTWDGEDAVVPVTAHGPEPLHAVYARSALPAIREALRERRLGLRALLDRLRVRAVEEAAWREADPEGRFARNLNRPEDLAGLL